MARKKISIACQGGGSQTAFTAGVLETFLDSKVYPRLNIVALSGASGGAICATLAWFSMIKAASDDTNPEAQRLTAFWQDNSTHFLHEELLNNFWVSALRLMEEGMLPQLATSPNTLLAQQVWPAITALLPHHNFYNLKALLRDHIDFDDIATWDRNKGPALLIGAADVLSGLFKKFSSRNGEITLESLLASAAVPTLFPAAHIGDKVYWDGMFSDNPPTDELLDEKLVGEENLPDEVWIIRINPQKCPTVPVSPGDISDRRNEMIGNQSLAHDKQKIELINHLLAAGAFTPAYQAKYRPVQVREIEMSEALQKRLDYATKLDRGRGFIEELMADGRDQGRFFLQKLGLDSASIAAEG